MTNKQISRAGCLAFDEAQPKLSEDMPEKLSFDISEVNAAYQTAEAAVASVKWGGEELWAVDALITKRSHNRTKSKRTTGASTVRAGLVLGTFAVPARGRADDKENDDVQ